MLGAAAVVLVAADRVVAVAVAAVVGVGEPGVVVVAGGRTAGGAARAPVLVVGATPAEGEVVTVAGNDPVGHAPFCAAGVSCG